MFYSVGFDIYNCFPFYTSPLQSPHTVRQGVTRQEPWPVAENCHTGSGARSRAGCWSPLGQFLLMSTHTQAVLCLWSLPPFHSSGGLPLLLCCWLSHHSPEHPQERCPGPFFPGTCQMPPAAEAPTCSSSCLSLSETVFLPCPAVRRILLKHCHSLCLNPCNGEQAPCRQQPHCYPGLTSGDLTCVSHIPAPARCRRVLGSWAGQPQNGDVSAGALPGTELPTLCPGPCVPAWLSPETGIPGGSGAWLTWVSSTELSHGE